VKRKSVAPEPDKPEWTFLTNHAHVLLCIAQDPEVRLVDIARLVGIGERAVHSIVTDLVDSGYVIRNKQGRNNVYEVRLDRPFRHPLEVEHNISDIFRPLTRQPKTRAR